MTKTWLLQQTKLDIHQDQLAKQAHYNNYYLSDPKFRKQSGGGNSGIMSGGNLSGGGSDVRDGMIIRNLKNVTQKQQPQRFQLTQAGQTMLNREKKELKNSDFEKKLHEKLMQNRMQNNDGFNIIHMG